MKQLLLLVLFWLFILFTCIFISEYINQIRLCKILETKDYNAYIEICQKQK